MSNTHSSTDWERLRNMKDAEAYANALADPDNPPLGEGALKGAVPLFAVPGKSLAERFRNAGKRRKVSVTARFDADIVDWYRAKGKGYQSIMNAALRACMEAEQAEEAGRGVQSQR